MVTPIHLPRKQRTRQHVIADLSVHHTERFILAEGYTAERVAKDYGYDLYLTTFDNQGFVETGLIPLQVKASETLVASALGYPFDLDIRDYHLWVVEIMPVILILYDASRNRAFWVYVQNYFRQTQSRQPGSKAKTVRLHVPQTQQLNRRAIRLFRAFKQDVLIRLQGVQLHD